MKSQGVVFQKHIGGKWPVFRAGGFWRRRPEIWGYLGFFPWGHENLIPPVGRQPSPHRTPPSASWVWSRCSGDMLWASAFQWVSLALCGAYNCIFFKHHCWSGATLLKAFLPGYPLKTRLHNMDGPSNCHTEWRKWNIIYHLYTESKKKKKMIQINLQNRDRQRMNLWLLGRRVEPGERVWDCHVHSCF